MNKIVLQEAVTFARQLSLNPFPADPFSICKELGIEIIYDKPMNKDGYLIYVSGSKLIFVSSHITNRHRQKFVVTHEIGHCLMHREQLYGCSNIEEANSTKVNSTQQEFEANSFASELLLPETQLKQIIPTDSLHFSEISNIAGFFDVSMTFAAIKCVQLSNTENEILLCYEGQNLKWYATGDKSVHSCNIPVKCPIDLTTTIRQSDIAGAWDTLYVGSVHQELFHPFKNQSLVLLIGIRCDAEEDNYEF